jgi:hypothetical protein
VKLAFFLYLSAFNPTASLKIKPDALCIFMGKCSNYRNVISLILAFSKANNFGVMMLITCQSLGANIRMEYLTSNIKQRENNASETECRFSLKRTVPYDISFKFRIS